MRLLIAGWQGQLARALVELVPGRPDVSSFAVGRPALDICEQPTIRRALSDARPDILVNAAAYTAVDAAESDREAAFALNSDGARMLAEAAASKNIPIIHVSTDYVFDGDSPRPYCEEDGTGPRTVYGQSKLEGERAVAAANPKHIILRTSWIFSAAGRNFVRTMLRLAEERSEARVVADQVGCPTYAPHLAAALLDVAAMVTDDPRENDRWGTYHTCGQGEASWFDFASAVMTGSGKRGGPAAKVVAISTADYPTAARRPSNSRLDCTKLLSTFGLQLPDWSVGLDDCLDRLLVDQRPAAT